MDTKDPCAEGQRVDDGPPGVEVLRIRLRDGTPFVWLPPPAGMGSVEMWGYVLCDAMLHIANAYRLEGGHDLGRTLERILAALQHRLQHPPNTRGMLSEN